MAEKDDKDIWEKFSDAAASAGKSLGEEYNKLKLTHDLWLLNRDLQKAYAHVGEVTYEQHTAEFEDPDEKLKSTFREIDDLRAQIAKLEEMRDGIGPKKDTKHAEPSAPGATSEGAGKDDTPSPADTAEMEFLDEGDIPFFCPECGVKLDAGPGKLPKHCTRCGQKLL